MATDKIVQNMEVIGADGVHVGTVDGVVNGRIRLAKRDSGEGQHKGHAHFIDLARTSRGRAFAFRRTRLWR